MPYAISSSNRSARPAATTFLATQRAAYAAERSTFVGSLPEKAPPPWRAMPPYVSTMILRPVRPASPIGPPVTNRPVGLTCITGSAGRSASGITGRITVSMMSSRIRLLGPLVLLRGDDDRADPLRHAALVLDGDLRLAVRAQVRERAVLADLGEAAGHAVRERDRQRHQLRGLAAGEPEHHPLVAGAQLLGPVHALRDVAALLLDADDRAARLVVEPVLGLRVADVADGVADDVLELDVRGRRDLAEHEDEAGGRRGLAGDAGLAGPCRGCCRGWRPRSGRTSCPGDLR